MIYFICLGEAYKYRFMRLPHASVFLVLCHNRLAEKPTWGSCCGSGGPQPVLVALEQPQGQTCEGGTATAACPVK